MRCLIDDIALGQHRDVFTRMASGELSPWRRQQATTDKWMALVFQHKCLRSSFRALCANQTN